jgi:hypothetical protein
MLELLLHLATLGKPRMQGALKERSQPAEPDLMDDFLHT